MNQINLLPEKVKRQDEMRRLLGAVAAAVMAGALLSGGGWWFLQQEVTTLKKEAERVENLNKQAVTAPEVNKEQQDTIARINQLNNLSSKDINWLRTFGLVSSILPADIHLTSYTITTNGGMNLKATGQAPSNLSFAVFVQSLQQNKDLTKVKVDAYNFDAVRGTVTFTWNSPVATSAVNYSSE